MGYLTVPISYSRRSCTTTLRSIFSNNDFFMRVSKGAFCLFAIHPLYLTQIWWLKLGVQGHQIHLFSRGICFQWFSVVRNLTGGSILSFNPLRNTSSSVESLVRVAGIIFTRSAVRKWSVGYNAATIARIYVLSKWTFIVLRGRYLNNEWMSSDCFSYDLRTALNVVRCRV